MPSSLTTSESSRSRTASGYTTGAICYCSGSLHVSLTFFSIQQSQGCITRQRPTVSHLAQTHLSRLGSSTAQFLFSRSLPCQADRILGRISEELPKDHSSAWRPRWCSSDRGYGRSCVWRRGGVNRPPSDKSVDLPRMCVSEPAIRHQMCPVRRA
jgi:hypothetical protein